MEGEIIITNRFRNNTYRIYQYLLKEFSSTPLVFPIHIKVCLLPTGNHGPLQQLQKLQQQKLPKQLP